MPYLLWLAAVLTDSIDCMQMLMSLPSQATTTLKVRLWPASMVGKLLCAINLFGPHQLPVAWICCLAEYPQS